MKIGIDISQIVYEGTGVARFTSGLVSAILDFDKNNQWLFFFSGFRRNLDGKLEEKILKSDHQLIKRKLPPSLLSFLWNDFHKFKIFNLKFKINLDWFITSDWTEPNLDCKKATIVHDLVYLRYPETVDEKIRDVQNKRLSLVKKESKIIFADSYSTKNDLIDLLKINNEKIKVIYPGVEITEPDNKTVSETRKKHNLLKPFILTVGKLEPRKNIERLIEAFNKINNNKIELVIVGPKGWRYSKNDKCQMTNVKYLGYINDIELSSLYKSCSFFVLPSLYEGFGYPLVEAMKLGVPVMCSNSSSLKEIAADNTLFFDPININEMTKCLNELMQDEKLRKELADKGKKRAEMFTWKSYYETLIKTLIQGK